MDCSQNRFCKSLNPELRESLCEHCTKRPFNKGMVVYRADIEPYITLIVDGVMTTQVDYGDGFLEEDDCPAFFINTNGLLLGIDYLFNDKPLKRYEYIQYICLTDGMMARFDRTFIRETFLSDNNLAKAMFQNIAIAAGEACEFAAVLRAPNVEESIRYLLKYASRKGLYLTQQQMAEITGHSRVSVTRAIARIKKNYPKLWGSYEACAKPRN